MNRRFAFQLTSFVSKFLYPFYLLYLTISKYTFVLESQVKKFSFKKPYPAIVFLGRHMTIVGARNIVLGNRVKISDYSTISTWECDTSNQPMIIIGENSEIGSFAHITAMNKIEIGKNVLMGKYVTITDNSHGKNSIKEIAIPPVKRTLFSKGSVLIEDNVWIGDKVTVLPSVHIGYGAIIGANTVVTKDVPKNAIVCGNPMRVINTITR